MSKKSIVLFVNGPPQSGKDKLATYLAEALEGSVYVAKFASPIEGFLQHCLGLTNAEYIKWREEDKDEVFTGLPNPDGLTFRQIMIDFSEDFMKPKFGDAVFGHLAVKRTLELFNGFDVVIFSDSGFQEEFNTFRETIPGVHSYLFRVHRDGKTYEGDSREYVVDRVIYDVDNNGTLEELRDYASSVATMIKDAHG